jgi:hypothetical protein
MLIVKYHLIDAAAAVATVERYSFSYYVLGGAALYAITAASCWLHTSLWWMSVRSCVVVIHRRKEKKEEKEESFWLNDS